jgi:hypothetical protein
MFSDDEGESTNPVPVLTKIFPVSKVSHLPTFTLTAHGTNFVKGSKIVFNGVEKETAFYTSTQLTCKINPEDIDFKALTAKSSGHLSKANSKDVQVLVRNPSPGGGDSDSFNFTIHENHTFIVLRKYFQGTASRLKTPISIAVDRVGIINMVWGDFGFSSHNSVIYYSRSTDKGSSFSQPVIVSDVTVDSYSPKIALDKSGNLHLVWTDRSIYINSDIFYTRAQNDGVSFSPAVNISNNSPHSSAPKIAVDSTGKIGVVWMNMIDDCDWPFGCTTNIHFSYSTAKGNSFSPVINISDHLFRSTGNLSPAMALGSDGDIYVVFKSMSNIYFSRSLDNGVSFSPEIKISNFSLYSTNPTVAVNSVRNLGMISKDSATEGLIINLFRPLYYGCRVPQIAVDNSGNINVIWQLMKSLNETKLGFCRSSDNGVSFSQPVKFSGYCTDYWKPQLAVDSAGNINVIWSGRLSATSERWDIFYCRSTDNGATFSPAVNISNSQILSDSPAIAVDSAGNIYLAWFEGSLGDWEIYFTSSVY